MGEALAPARPLHLEKLEEGQQPDADAFDWLGRPATKKQGGPRTSIFILANQGLWNVANFGVGTNLVLYFTRVLQLSNAAAANNVTNWFGTMWMTTLLGGFLGDSYWGRFWTCVVFQIVHLVGLLMLSLSVTLDSLKPPFCAASGTLSCPKPSSIKVNFFFISIYIIAIGSGGYLPAFQALGADQFDSEKHRTKFFGWLFFFTNIGIILANTVFVYVENQGRWGLGYWLSTGVGGLAMIMFCLGLPTYRQYRAGGNPFRRAAQVVVATLRKWKVQVPVDDNALHEVAERELVRKGSRKMAHTTKFRYFDKAATKVGSEDMRGEGVDPWRLCTVTQVEEVKCLCRMMPIWLGAILFSAVFSQINTLFIEQAATMDTRLGSFNIPPASISVFNVLSIFLWTILYSSLVVPFTRKLTGNPNGLTQLQRMGIGQLGSTVAMAVAALVETKRLKVVREHGLENVLPFIHPVPMSIFWLVPQNVLLGAAQVFVVVGAMDFFYSEAPHAMRSMVGALSLANLAIGSYASSVIVSVVMKLTTRGGKAGWISANLNGGHVDYFYWVLVGITLFNTAIFVVAARWYKYNSKVQSGSEQSVVHPSASPESSKESSEKQLSREVKLPSSITP